MAINEVFSRKTKKLVLTIILFSISAFCQTNGGELRLTVVDPSGRTIKTAVRIRCDGNQYLKLFITDESGKLVASYLPFGIYQIDIQQPGFQPISDSVNIKSSLPAQLDIQLKLATVDQSLIIHASNTLIDPDEPGAVNQIGTQEIRTRTTSIPGRSLQDLVNSQPGWLYEGNAVLHPRGSEYQTQFVIDGIPLIDNRSPSFGPEIQVDDVQSMSIYTAGIPAEYGRKMGGVVEVNTTQDLQTGSHGQIVLSGGSFNSAGTAAEGQYVWGKSAFGASASGSMTDHYLNPVVPQNYSNTGTLGDFSTNYDQAVTPNDRLTFIIRHEVSRYDIPNEQVQQAAGQRQTADNIETLGIVSYQHIYSPHMLAAFRGMVRDNASDFNSNTDSTPVEVFQKNAFREGYFKGTVTADHGRHEWKIGVESDNIFLKENFNYFITDPDRFDDGTPLTFHFMGSKPDLEQAVFVEDLIHLGNWTVSAGLRWDHYQLLLNRQALEPRLSISHYFPSSGLTAHFSYDRIFQTPSFENILLSNSAGIRSLDPSNFLRLPVEPSKGNYYEAGLTKVIFKNLRLDANYFRRMVDNYADDDQIANTTVSFPIAFQRSVIYGTEGKLVVPDWRHFSGYLSYSYEVGNVWFPVTGGLFLGDDASAAQSQVNGHFPGSQDQRNTIRGRVRYQIHPRLWLASGIEYDSGLPFEFDGARSDVLQQYGQQMIDRVNFDRARIFPALLFSASVGMTISKSERMIMSLQVDGENLSNVLDVVDFGGLFSGNSIGPSRSFGLRLTTNF